eukprot:jgi/Chlat1/5615/Chrsp369S00860
MGQKPSSPVHECRRSSSSSGDVDKAVEALRSRHRRRQARAFNTMLVGRQHSGKSLATNTIFKLTDGIIDTPGKNGNSADLATLQHWAQGVRVVIGDGSRLEDCPENRADIIIVVVEMETLLSATTSSPNREYVQDLRAQVSHFRNPQRVGGPLPVILFGNFPPNMSVAQRRNAQAALRQVTEVDTMFCGNLTLTEACTRDCPHNTRFDDYNMQVTVIRMLEQAAQFFESLSVEPAHTPTAGGDEPVETSSSNSQREVCAICQTNRRTHAFTPCMHYMACEPCANIVIGDDNRRTCPICGQAAAGLARVFAS